MKMRTKVTIIFILLMTFLNLKVFATEQVPIQNVEITNENIYEIYEEAIKNKVTKNEVVEENKNDAPSFFTNATSVKNYIKQEARKASAEIDISSYGITEEELYQLMSTLFLDPEMFFINGYGGYMLGDKVTILVLSYTMTAEEIENYWTGINKTTQDYLSKIDDSMTTLDKIIFTNNYLCQICDYVEYENEEELNYIDWSYHTMAKALTEGYAVCDGYSKAFAYLLSQVGVEASLVTSNLLNHAWNLVKLENDYYHIDTTWNDVGVYGKVTYTYFMLSDTAMYNRGHNQDDWVQEYAATNTQFDSNNNAWINGIDNYLIYEDGYWYGLGLVQNDYTCFVLYKFDVNANTYTSTIVNVDMLYSYPGLTSDGEKLYFSLDDKIMEMDFNGENVELFYTTDIFEEEYIYSLEYRNGKYYYVTYADGLTTYFVAPVREISLDKTEIALAIDEKYTFTVTYNPEDATDGKEIKSWTSSNETVATVENGVVTAKSLGNTTITVETVGGKKATCEITVSDIPEFTTLPVTVISEKSIFSFAKDTVIKDAVVEANFPILSIGYKVEVLNESGIQKADTEKLGSKNVVQIKNGDEVLKVFTVVVRGDIDGDGRARIFDSFEILKDSVITSEYDEIDTLIRDYDGDERVRIFDAFEYLRDSIL